MMVILFHFAFLLPLWITIICTSLGPRFICLSALYLRPSSSSPRAAGPTGRLFTYGSSRPSGGYGVNEWATYREPEGRVVPVTALPSGSRSCRRFTLGIACQLLPRPLRCPFRGRYEWSYEGETRPYGRNGANIGHKWWKLVRNSRISWLLSGFTLY